MKRNEAMKAVHSQIPLPLYDEMEQACRDHDLSVAQMMRRALKLYLAQLKEEG